jgi:hypothetical protein
MCQEYEGILFTTCAVNYLREIRTRTAYRRGSGGQTPARHLYRAHRVVFAAQHGTPQAPHC